ncbi:GGDEF domain-containing protein [Devosia ginsengisoli]|uniref:diguanylate cyclase n=2 Tax=Devosia ginsengisoli TaxID=400770 RepID=A0A5B8LPU5_9HYPH|nr:GGDEF domain-containing protein [Devosia ginsengisoli]
MTVMVGLNIVIAGILGFTAALCAGASMGMRGNRPMSWLAVALAMGSVQTLVMTFAGGSWFEASAAAMLAPPAYLSAGRAIRALAPRPGSGLPVVAVVLGLSATALVLQAMGSPYFYQALAVQLACTIAVGDAAYQMVRRARRSLLDGVTIALLCALVAFSAVRVPLLLNLFGPEVTFTSFRQSWLETALLSVSGLLVPPIIFLLLARTVSDTIATYQRQSERDGLTGLLNRRAFDTTADAALSNGGAVIFCDIDNFKQVNDRFGHEAGDDVICTLAALLAESGHPAGRIGGEEFALLLPGQNVESAMELADDIRARFNGTLHPVLSPNEWLSTSFGVSYCAPGESPRAAFRRADVALYRAKEAGRNQVSAFMPNPDVTTTPSPRAAA